MPVRPEIERRVRELPDRPGIYIFRDGAGEPLYVGKASSLRKRVASYLTGTQEARISSMLAAACELEIVVTDSETEALLLENNWIKRHRPRFNILLRDDKTYPYVKLTLHDEYPRIALTRRLVDDGSEYFGPYLPGGLARKAIKLVQKLFEIRVCRLDIDGSLPRPCLYFDMQRCLGPCVEGLTDRHRYGRAVEDARLFLKGRNDQLLRSLRQEMMAAADREEFERAARLRDLMSEIEALSERRKLSSTKGEDIDVYGVHVHKNRVAICILVMRNGQVLDRRELFWEGDEDVSEAGALQELLPQIYDRTSFIPKEIHLPIPVAGEKALEQWLGQRKEERVYLRFPTRGSAAQRVALAMRNAMLAHRRRFRSVDSRGRAEESLRRELELVEAPRCIEGFDISTLHGDQSVASLVVWEEGSFQRREYRSFNIKGIEGADDFAAIGQAVMRRYRRRLEELGSMPDLILVDGGRGQLNAALEALAALGVEEVPVVGLAKRQEELYVPDRPEPIRLDKRDPGLQLLQQVRDEAHRFALARHRRRRSRVSLRGALEEVKGIGPQRRKRLLKRFGSVEGVREAELSDLQQELGSVIGERVHTILRQEEAQRSPSPDRDA